MKVIGKTSLVLIPCTKKQAKNAQSGPQVFCALTPSLKQPKYSSKLDMRGQRKVK
jgi:hypothetical protein